MNSTLSIRRLTLDDYDALYLFFNIIKENQLDITFHPHPFDKETARSVCLEKQEFFCGMFLGKNLIGYGLLRGYAEGYSIPSLGICIHSKYSGLKLGQTLMLYLHSQARLLGNKQIRLRVYKNNLTAIHLYTKLGYKLTEYNERELIGFINLE